MRASQGCEITVSCSSKTAMTALSLDKLVSKEKISKEEGESIFSRITPIVDLNEAVKNAELIIEVVPEMR